MRAGMEILRPRPTFLAFAALVALIALTLPAGASAAGRCVDLKVSKRKVEDGSTVRVKGHTCGAGRSNRVRIKIRKKGHWRIADRARARGNGSFAGRVRVNARGRRVIRLRAIVDGHRSRMVRLHVTPGDCAIDSPTTPIGMTLPGCRLIASDTTSKADARSFWGNIDCGHWENPDPNRAAFVAAGGDPHSTATGAPQPDNAYRRMTAFDGDDYSGERCELGMNDHQDGPTAFYHEGQHRVTFISFRLPPDFPIGTETWQNVMQMKQSQPSDGGSDVPILFMGARENEWQLDSSNPDQGYGWPARPGFWTRFAFDVIYSQDPNRGRLQVSADLNGDSDFDDGGERSPVYRTSTLKTEIDGPNGSSDGLAPGDPIPSHLRAGLYHNSTVPCPAPGGCSVEVDNVQVLAP